MTCFSDRGFPALKESKPIPNRFYTTYLANSGLDIVHEFQGLILSLFRRATEALDGFGGRLHQFEYVRTYNTYYRSTSPQLFLETLCRTNSIGRIRRVEEFIIEDQPNAIRCCPFQNIRGKEYLGFEHGEIARIVLEAETRRDPG